LPGCISDGETTQEALANIEIIINEWLETTREEGREIPTPKGRAVNA
jgi:predicted RNase H-like HicB family nuclease